MEIKRDQSDDRELVRRCMNVASAGLKMESPEFSQTLERHRESALCKLNGHLGRLRLLSAKVAALRLQIKTLLNYGLAMAEVSIDAVDRSGVSLLRKNDLMPPTLRVVPYEGGKLGGWYPMILDLQSAKHSRTVEVLSPLMHTFFQDGPDIHPDISFERIPLRFLVRQVSKQPTPPPGYHLLAWSQSQAKINPCDIGAVTFERNIMDFIEPGIQ